MPRHGDLGWRPTRRGGSLVVTPHRRVRDVLVNGGVGTTCMSTTSRTL
jgi:hypothetical protein